MKQILLSLAVLCVSLSSSGQSGQRKLLFIGIDGCRWDAVIAANAPNIDNLLPHAIYSPHGLTYYKTWSGTGWSNMLTGAWHTKHGVNDNTFTGSNYTQYPDFISRVENYNSNLKTISVVHWAPLNTTIIQSIDREVNVASDLAVKDTAVAILTNANPDVLFVAFDDVDHAGHSYGFSPTTPNYLQAIENTDIYIGSIVTALQNRPNYPNEDWLIILTTDHGGTPTGHGGGTLEERTIFHVYNNPHFAAQTFSRTTVSSSSIFNEAHFNAGTFAKPVNQAPFLFGTSQDFTIEFWVKATAYTNDPALVSNKNWNSGANKGFVISAQQGQYWKVNVGDGTNRLDIQGGFLQPNQWHHLAVSFNRTGLVTAYEDGVIVGFYSMQNIGDLNSGLPLVINQDGTTTYGSNFDGSIKDIRIWNSVIPANTLAQWATLPVTSAHPNYSSLLANWKCTDGSGSVLQDAGIAANHCNVTGALAWAPNQTSLFTVYNYSATPRQPDNAVTAMDWLCVPIQPSWNLDGKSWITPPLVSASSGTICSGKVYTISVGGAITYSINGIGTTNFTVSPVVSSSYSVTGTNGCVLANTAVANVSVGATPTVVVNSASVCAGNVATLTASGADLYLWSNSQPGTGIGVAPAITSTYAVTGTNSSNSCTSAVTATVTVESINIAASAGSKICAGETGTLSASGANSYTWSTGEQGTSISVSPTITSAYLVQGLGNNGCTGTVSVTLYVDACTGISELKNTGNELKIYPNPANEILNIEFDHVISIQIFLYNGCGKEVISTRCENSAQQMDISNLPKGLYFIKAGTKIQKFIKE